MADIVIAAIIAAIAALGAPWMNALATRWLESSRKRANPKATARSIRRAPSASTSLTRLIATLSAAPFYAMAAWAFLIAPSVFHDEGALRGIVALIFAFIFVVAGHYTREFLIKSGK